MQAEQRGQCLILLLCAWAFLTAGPALCVYGAQEKEQIQKLPGKSVHFQHIRRCSFGTGISVIR